VACQILPIAAEINATTKNVKPVRKRSPPVRNQTAIAASAAMGNANRKPKTTIMIKPMMSKIISNHKSCVGSVGTAICRVDKKADKNSPLPRKRSFKKYLNNFE
jgi:hypothetical protein